VPPKKGHNTPVQAWPWGYALQILDYRLGTGFGQGPIIGHFHSFSLIVNPFINGKLKFKQHSISKVNVAQGMIEVSAVNAYSNILKNS